MAKVTIIGTSHISPESVKSTREMIQREKPECVAVELDPERYYALKTKAVGRSIKFGVTGLILQFLQESLSKKTDIMPGSEMMSAIDAAIGVGAKVVLIDMPIRDTMLKIKRIPLARKLKFFYKLVFGFLQKDKMNIDLNKVPEDKLIAEALKFMKKEFPDFYRILISDRNKYMCRWIRKLSDDFDSIIVVVGAGHRDELKRMLK